MVRISNQSSNLLNLVVLTLECLLPDNPFYSKILQIDFANRFGNLIHFIQKLNDSSFFAFINFIIDTRYLDIFIIYWNDLKSNLFLSLSL